MHANSDGDGAKRDRTDRPAGADPTRRDLMKAAGAGIGVVALGSTMTSSAGASQEDGPGQEIPTPRLSVDGNTVVDPEGNVVKLRGLNMADPGLIDHTAHARGKNALQVVDFLTNRDEGWYPRVLRIPVEPGSVAELTPVPLADYETGDYPVGAFDATDLEAYCEDHLDPVVDRCGERNVYCIVDYHRHWGDGNQQWDDDDLHDEVMLFWDFVAARYGDREHVLFEVYNEPTRPPVHGDPSDEYDPGQEQWFHWVDTAQPWVDQIREHSDNIVLIGSPNWTQVPEGALVRPFEGENLAYTYHIYAGHTVSDDEAWDEDHNREGVGLGGTPVYEEYPLFVTEFGWETVGAYFHYVLEGTTEGFGTTFLEWLEGSEGISYTAWCADPIWRPVMFSRPFAEDDPYLPADHDAVGDPYGDADPVENHCPDLPCEWELLGPDSSEDGDWSGQAIKAHLAEYRNEDVPSGEVEPPAPSEPDPPTGLEAVSVGETSIELAWGGDPDATGYAVYLDGALETEVSGTSATLEGLEPDTSYELGVASLGADDFESEATTVTATTADGDGSDNCTADEIEVGDNCATDVDGDGLYRDVDGTGTTGSNDVVQFFRHVEDEAVQANPDAFDFNESGGVGFDDVVALFGQI